MEKFSNVALWREREVYKIRIRENFDLDIWRRETVLSVIMMIELGLDRRSTALKGKSVDR